jgi:hypothetical protein
VEKRTGLMRRVDGAWWRFPHDAFREALAAEELLRRVAGRRLSPGEKVAVDVADPGEKLKPIESEAASLAGDGRRWAEALLLVAERVDPPDVIVNAFPEGELRVRAVAAIAGLKPETVIEALDLSPREPDKRHAVFARLIDLAPDSEAAVSLLERAAGALECDGNDLYFIDLALADAGERWPEQRTRAERARDRLIRRRRPDAALFDGMWRTIPASGALPAFRLGAAPITNRQFAAFDPRHHAAGWQEEHPVVDVTWFEAASFCRWLGTLPGCRGARLPTEAEWEWACRGDAPEWYLPPDAVAWYRANSGLHTHPVGELRPNPFGLCDILGNVWQWCLDQHDRADAAADPYTFRVMRGACFDDDAREVRPEARGLAAPITRSSIVGFRVLLPQPGEGAR